MNKVALAVMGLLRGISELCYLGRRIAFAPGLLVVTTLLCSSVAYAECTVGYCLPQDSNGWTSLTPATNVNIVYVSLEGNDETAQVYTTSQVGTDPTQPIVAVQSFRTIAAAKAQVGDGWLLLKRGQHFADSFGVWTQFGRSPSEPALIGAYGNGARPIVEVQNRQGIPAGQNYAAITIPAPPEGKDWNLVLSGIEVWPHRLGGSGGIIALGRTAQNPARNLLIEDVKVTRCALGIVVDGGSSTQILTPDTIANVTIRRSVTAENVDTFSDWSGGEMYLSAIDGLLVEENVLDFGGWTNRFPSHDRIYPLNNSLTEWRAVSNGLLNIPIARPNPSNPNERIWTSYEIAGINFTAIQSLQEVAQKIQDAINVAVGENAVNASLFYDEPSATNWLVLLANRPAFSAINYLSPYQNPPSGGVQLIDIPYLGSAGGNVRPSVFRHGLYIQHSIPSHQVTLANPPHVVVRGNIVARSASEGIQQRTGGVLEENLFIKNSSNLLGRTGRAFNNVFLDSRDIDLGIPRGGGLGVQNAGQEGEESEVYSNIFAHRTEPATYNVGAIGISTYPVYQLTHASIHDNIVYDWHIEGAGEAHALAIGEGATASIFRNQFQMPRGEYVVRIPYLTGSTLSFAENHYYSVHPYPFWFGSPVCLYTNFCNFSSWPAVSGESGAIFSQINYRDPERDIPTYMRDIINAEPSLDAFMTEALKQSKDNWRQQYTARAVNDYIREGFQVCNGSGCQAPIRHYSIVASSGPHGSIDPAGTVVVNQGASVQFRITPESGYEIAQILVNGTTVCGATCPSSYSFNNVQSNGSISVGFSLVGAGSSSSSSSSSAGSIGPIGTSSVAVTSAPASSSSMSSTSESSSSVAPSSSVSSASSSGSSTSAGPTPPRAITAVVTVGKTTEGSTSNPGKIVIQRSGSLNQSLNVYYTISGTARNGKDYRRLSGRATIARNKRSVTVKVEAVRDRLSEPAEDVVLKFVPNAQYSVVGNPKATVIILNRKR